MRLIDADRLKSWFIERFDFELEHIMEIQVMDAIDDQPTANEWIKYNPEKPPETGDYIVTWTDGVAEYVGNDLFYKKTKRWEEYGNTVIAYMPAPEPCEYWL